MTVQERRLVQKEMQKPLQEAITSCENMTTLASRLFYRALDPVLKGVLSPQRYSEVTTQWRDLLDLTLAEVAQRDSPAYNKIVIRPEGR